jgi:hypothetical protein
MDEERAAKSAMAKKATARRKRIDVMGKREPPKVKRRAGAAGTFPPARAA